MTTSSIRKAAILISTLDDSSADALLEQMGEEMAERVRNALMELEEIPEEEQQQVIAEFMNHSPDGIDDEGVEFDPSLARRLENDLPVPTPRGGSSEPPFHFLRDAEPALLAAYLEKEHSQTAAVVISHLPPEQAAEVLERMPAEKSTEALRRMAWLDELSPEILRDVERELQAALLPRLRSKEARLAGLANVQAVLSAVQGPRRSELIDRLAEQDHRLARQLGYGAIDHGPHSTPRTEVAAFRYRLEPPPLLESAALTPTQNRGLGVSEFSEGEFAELLTLSDRDLRRVFAAAEMPVLVLALTGADDKFTRRILRQLSSREAEVLRHKLTHPGPLRLRDIEQAQEEIMRLARNLASRGEINLPTAGFAAAV